MLYLYMSFSSQEKTHVIIYKRAFSVSTDRTFDSG